MSVRIKKRRKIIVGGQTYIWYVTLAVDHLQSGYESVVFQCSTKKAKLDRVIVPEIDCNVAIPCIFRQPFQNHLLFLSKTIDFFNRIWYNADVAFYVQI